MFLLFHCLVKFILLLHGTIFSANSLFVKGYCMAFVQYCASQYFSPYCTWSFAVLHGLPRKFYVFANGYFWPIVTGHGAGTRLNQVNVVCLCLWAVMAWTPGPWWLFVWHSAWNNVFVQPVPGCDILFPWSNCRIVWYGSVAATWHFCRTACKHTTIALLVLFLFFAIFLSWSLWCNSTTAMLLYRMPFHQLSIYKQFTCYYAL